MRKIELSQGETMTFNGIDFVGPRTVYLSDAGIIGAHADAINDLSQRVRALERDQKDFNVESVAKAVSGFIFNDIRSNGPIARAFKNL